MEQLWGNSRRPEPAPASLTDLPPGWGAVGAGAWGSWAGQVSQSPSPLPRSMGLMVTASLIAGGPVPLPPRQEPQALPAYHLLGKSPIFPEHALTMSGIASRDLEQLPDPQAGKTCHPSGSLCSGVLSRPASWTMGAGSKLRPRRAGIRGRGGAPPTLPLLVDGRAQCTAEPGRLTSTPGALLWGRLPRPPQLGVCMGRRGSCGGAPSRVPRGMPGRRQAGSTDARLSRCMQSLPSRVLCHGESDRPTLNNRGYCIVGWGRWKETG